MTGRLFVRVDEQLAQQLVDLTGNQYIADEIRAALFRMVAFGPRRTMRAIRNNHLGLTVQANEHVILCEDSSRVLRLDLSDREKELISSFMKKITLSTNSREIKNQTKIKRRFCVAYAILLHLKRDMIAACSDHFLIPAGLLQ